MFSLAMPSSIFSSVTYICYLCCLISLIGPFGFPFIIKVIMVGFEGTQNHKYVTLGNSFFFISSNSFFLMVDWQTFVKCTGTWAVKILRH